MESVTEYIISSKIVEWGDREITVENVIVNEDGEMRVERQVLDYNHPTDWG